MRNLPFSFTRPSDALGQEGYAAYRRFWRSQSTAPVIAPLTGFAPVAVTDID